MPVDRCMPVPSHLPTAAEEEIASWTRLGWLSGMEMPHLIRAHNHGFNDAAGHCLLHACSEAEAEACLARLRVEHPALADRTYPIIFPPTSQLTPASSLIIRLAALRIRSALADSASTPAVGADHVKWRPPRNCRPRSCVLSSPSCK